MIQVAIKYLVEARGACVGSTPNISHLVMDMPFNRIIIDSRHAANGNNTSFEVSLPESISLPPHAVCFVSDIQVTHTFSSMRNRSEFYFIERDATGTTLVNKAILDTSNTHSAYTLATDL